MSVPRVFKSSDAGAPVWDDSVGAFQRIMEAIITDGYGSTSALAGWTIPYSLPNDKFVMKNDPVLGSGTYYQISRSTDQDYSGVCFMYDTMSDVNTGLGQVPNPVFTHNNKWGNFLWWRVANTAYDWMVIADERTIYAFVALSSANSSYPDLNPHHMLLFGDYNRSTGQVLNSGICNVGELTYDYGHYAQLKVISGIKSDWGVIPSPRGISIKSNLSGESDVYATLYSQVGLVNYQQSPNYSMPYYPHPLIDYFETHKIYIKSETTNTDNTMQTLGEIRGLLKTNFRNASGLLYYQAGVEMGKPEDITLNGKVYIGIPILPSNPDAYYTAQYILIDITDDWGV